LTLAVASCQRYHAGPFVAYDMMAADDPDLVVFLGDYIYEMGAREQEVRGTWAWPANTLAD
jgi:alkaline phosphatase D